MPKKIEFIIRDNGANDIGNLTININSYNEQFNKSVFSLPDCILNATNHDQITIKFATEKLEDLKKIKDEMHQVERKLFSITNFITPIR